MPTKDVTPPGYPQARFYDRASGESSEHPVVTARVAETTCRSQATSSQTGTADLNSRQRPVTQLPKMGKEKLKSISSQCSARQPQTSTPMESVRSQPAETESMEVDTPVVHATSKDSSASVVASSATQGVGASQAYVNWPVL